MEARLSPELDTALSCVRYELWRMHRAEKGLDLPTSHHPARSLSSPERFEEDESEWFSDHDEHAIPVLDSVETWRACAYKLHSKHSLPYFSELFTQLQIHEEWMMRLPWYCKVHRTPHGHDILDDVLSSTEPEDDTAPDNEYFTCICFEAVYLPAPGETGEISDAVQCSSCYARFHHQCAAEFKYCPFCDPMFWNGSIQSSRTRTWHFYSLKTLLQNAPCVSKKYSEAHEELEIIVHKTDRLCTVIQRFLSLTVPHEVRENEIKQMRHYMRKLHKLQFTVSPDPKTSFALELCQLYTSSCLIMEPGPKFQFGTDFDEVWNDGTLCVCRGQLPEMHGVAPVHCVNCRRRYHAACIFFKGEPIDSQSDRVTVSCPLCCLRKGIDYPWAEIRVRHPGAFTCVFVSSIAPLTRVFTLQKLPTIRLL